MAFNECVLQRVQSVLQLDKQIKHAGFSSVLERDLKNTLERYFVIAEGGLKIDFKPKRDGMVDLVVVLENAKPKKVGINA